MRRKSSAVFIALRHFAGGVLLEKTDFDAAAGGSFTFVSQHCVNYEPKYGIDSELLFIQHTVTSYAHFKKSSSLQF